jgi:hypothetical protein
MGAGVRTETLAILARTTCPGRGPCFSRWTAPGWSTGFPGISQDFGGFFRKSRRVGRGNCWSPDNRLSSCATAGCVPGGERAPLHSEDLVDLFRQLEIQIADPLNAVGVQVDHDLIPYVEPFRMMVHPLGHQSHLRHFSECRHEILALEFLVQLAVLQAPAFDGLQVLLNIRFAKFFGSHLCASGPASGGPIMGPEARGGNILLPVIACFCEIQYA